MSRILFRHADILTLDPNRPLLRNSVLSVKNGLIESVGQELPGPYERIIDASGRILMPGLVNAHTHSPMTLLRGLKDDCPLDLWLRDYIWPAEAALSREDYYYGALLGIAEMLATGTTSMTDMYRASTEILRAACDTGIKANICESITSDDTFDPSSHTGVLESRATIDAYQKYDNGRILCDTSIQSCWQTEPKLWKYISDFAYERKIGVHIHLAETQDELRHCQQRYGLSPVRLLEKAGVFRNRIIAVHGIYLSEEDQQILKEHDACIVHDPASNLKCCCGFANLKPCYDKGIPLALGTDGVCSNNSGDLFDTIKLTALVQKMLANDPAFMSAETLLEMATQGGLYSQGRAGQAGMLREDMDADLILVDSDFPSMQPSLSPAGSLVYAASGALVRLTMVRGRILYENGRFTTIDIQNVRNKVRQITSRF